MRDFLTIGSSPYDEDCAQVGSANYNERARLECKLYAEQLREIHGVEPHGAELRIKSFPHDFGSYSEVVCYYDDNIEESVEYAYRLEEDSTSHWTPDRAKILKERGFLKE